MEISLHLPDLVGYWNRLCEWWAAFSTNEQIYIVLGVWITFSLIAGKIAYHVTPKQKDKLNRAISMFFIIPLCIPAMPLFLVLGTLCVLARLIHLFFSFGAKKGE